MSSYTINGSECQELFLDRSNSVYDTEKSYYRRKDISLSVRMEIALYLLEREGQYGVVTPLSAAYDVSRTFMYNLRGTARGALEMALAGGLPGRPMISSTIEVDKNRLDRGIVTLAVAGAVAGAVARSCEVRSKAKRSKTKQSGVVQLIRRKE